MIIGYIKGKSSIDLQENIGKENLGESGQVERHFSKLLKNVPREKGTKVSVNRKAKLDRKQKSSLPRKEGIKA